MWIFAVKRATAAFVPAPISLVATAAARCCLKRADMCRYCVTDAVI
jgi:hypothetical protein